MNEKGIGFGVLGLGMGAIHCHAIGRADGARLVAICDLDPERLAKVKDEHGCTAYGDYTQMLEDPEVDVISVVTPSGMHLGHGLMAARAGKHILMEKPVEITPEKIQRLVEGVRETGVKCGCVFQSRINDLYIKMREAIEAGRLGKLAAIHATLPWYRADSYYEGKHGTWRATWEMDGGGSLMNQGIHSLDMMIFLGGRVKSVFAKYGVFTHDVEAEDNLSAVLTFESGVLGNLTTSTSAYPGLPGQYVVFGEKGSIHADERGLLAWNIAGESEEEESKKMLEEFGPEEEDLAVASDPMAVWSRGHIKLIADLASAIREGRDPLITLDLARHAPEVACAIYESGRTGKEVLV